MRNEQNKMNILVTGCAGFIGAKVAEMLLKQGHSVVGIDNMNDYYDVRLKKYRLNAVSSKYIGTHWGFWSYDVEKRGKLSRLFTNNSFDAVIHLAARAGVRYSIENPHIYATTNVIGTLNLLECCRQYNVKKFVLASTSSLYAGQPMPFKEDLPVNEPISPYAATKKGAEALAYTYSYLYGIDVSVVRYFTVYGPAGRPDMCIFRFIKWIDDGTPIELFGDGRQSRDFTYVDDIARGTIAACMTETGHQVINLGGNQPYTLNIIIELICQRLGKSAERVFKPFHKTDIKATAADISKAAALLGWHPTVNMTDGIKKTVDWYLENKEFVSTIQLP